MANNRELSQLGSIVNIDNSNRSVGFGASVGIGTNQPGYELDVNGDVNFTGDLYQNGSLFTSGLGVGLATVTPTTGDITNRIGVGFTDMNFIGTGITVTGYGSTVVVDMSSIAAASASGSDDAVIFAIAFG
jgi:hypothetical protein|tara:strand:- start:567 stop:959 length:393 start_codon:yes stop_codon:yes gene_type:complete